MQVSQQGISNSTYGDIDRYKGQTHGGDAENVSNQERLEMEIESSKLVSVGE